MTFGGICIGGPAHGFQYASESPWLSLHQIWWGSSWWTTQPPDDEPVNVNPITYRYMRNEFGTWWVVP